MRVKCIESQKKEEEKRRNTVNINYVGIIYSREQVFDAQENYIPSQIKKKL